MSAFPVCPGRRNLTPTGRPIPPSGRVRRPGNRMIQTTHIVPLRTGWDPNPAAPPWYPDDLPDDWRLGYFSNAFWAVLVPAAQWRAAGPAVAGRWAEDTPLRFRFYLEREWAPDGLARTDLEPFARALRERFGRPGDVRVVDSRGRGAHLSLRQVLAPPIHPSDSLALPGRSPGLALADPRATRSWIEERVREAPPGPPAGPAWRLPLRGPGALADLDRDNGSRLTPPTPVRTMAGFGLSQIHPEAKSPRDGDA